MSQKRKRLFLLGCTIALLLLSTWSEVEVAKGQGEGSNLFLPLVVATKERPGGQGIPRTEQLALEALYTNTQGAAWTDQTGWLQTEDPCSWHGVVCQQGHVTTLDLPQNNLSGPLPAEIDDLPNLVNLYLYENNLTTLPATIGNLANLEFLDLSGNQLSALPAEIGALSSVVELDLADNQLAALPAEIGNLGSLEDLNLSGNQLAELPAEIGSLTNLQGLYLWDNQLAELPAEIGSLTNLQALYVWNNQLTTLPAAIGNLANLQWLNLTGNRLASLPLEITHVALTQLDVGENCLISVTDPTLIAWLDSHDGDWAQTQRTDCAP